MKESVIKSVTRILDNYLEVTRHRKTPERYTILRAIYNHKGHFTLDELKVELVSSDLHDLWEGDRDYLPGDCGGCRERRTETLPQRRFQSLHLWCLQYLSGKTHA